MISPVFKLDSRGTFRPQPVETVETFAKIDGVPVKLDALPPSGGRMDFPDGLKDPENTPVVGYHRMVPRADLFWHQFWLWYLDNPWNIAGFGEHEGDREFVQIATVDEGGDHPVLVTASQHHTGEKREFWRCEFDTPTRRPVIYAARGSHANHYSPEGSPRSPHNETAASKRALPIPRRRASGATMPEASSDSKRHGVGSHSPVHTPPALTCSVW